MADRGAVLKKGNLQPNVALFARFPPEADQSQWVVKQALDIGLMGVIFNGVDSKEQALLAVRSMRYPQLKGSPRMEPAGIRGYGPAGAAWIWGLSAADYERHADLWPLNPDGDLLATIMIESVDGSEEPRRDRRGARRRRAVSRRRRGSVALAGRRPEFARAGSRRFSRCCGHARRTRSRA